LLAQITKTGEVANINWIQEKIAEIGV
jgi:hypothetical protein